MSRANITLAESWKRTSWQGYDSYQAQTDSRTLGRTASVDYPFGLDTQQHIDVRSFTSDRTWTGSGLVIGSISSVNHFPGATITLSDTASHTFTSISTVPVDLTQLNDPGAYLTVPLANFPLSQIDLNNSYLDLSSDGFSTAICALQWATSTSTPGSGYTTLTWPYSALTGCDLTNVTGLRFRIKALSAPATVYILNVRLLGSEWVQLNSDFDSRAGRLRQTIPLDGNPAETTVANNEVLPTLWRSADIPGVDDPRPINAEMGYYLYTGASSSYNSFTMYMRESNEAFQTQLDLEGQTQLDLSGKPQPITGITTRTARTLGDLDQFTVGELDQQTMINLDATNGLANSSWVMFQVHWGPMPGIQITSSADPLGGYIYTGATAPTFTANTTYLVVCTLAETTARVQIYNVNSTTFQATTLAFDTMVIPDATHFPRRRGRVGFQALLQDGDAFIEGVRPRETLYAEYRSHPLASLTPVRGARLYVQSTPDAEYFTGFTPLADTGSRQPTVSIDESRYYGTSSDDASTRVDVSIPSTATPAQGVISNVLSPDAFTGFQNFRYARLAFHIWVPASVLNSTVVSGATAPIAAALVSSYGTVIPLNIPPLPPDHWYPVSMPLPLTQADLYQLVFYYQATQGGSFWLDTVSVTEQNMRWSARSVADDSWDSNYAPWTDFGSLINSDTNGVRFDSFGKALQMRGQALAQNAAIASPPKLVPQYAELGRLVWPEQKFTGTIRPTVTMSVTHTTGRTYTFDGRSSTSPNQIANYAWSFGDGTFATGPFATHTFTLAGTYTSTLTVTDRYGLTAIASNVETVA